MPELSELREKINSIDDKIAELFEERMKVCGDIGEYKKEYSLPVRDKEREQAVLDKAAERIGNDILRPYYGDLQKKIMELSCSYQERLISGMKPAYSGVPGAYAYIATRRLFPSCEPYPYANFEQAYMAAETGECDCAVLPIENSYAGEVGAVMDMLYSGGLYISRILSLDVEHHLIGLPGADRKGIKTVISHPQALAQCDSFIKERNYKTVEGTNTAAAAKYVKELGDPTTAAIASEETAEIFGLEVIERKIYTSKNNSTRFGVFSRNLNLPDEDAPDEGLGFTMVFTVPDEAGALAMTLDIIGSHGYNMRALKSRPLKGLSWTYYFYVEGEGNINSIEGQNMLRELSAVCGDVRHVSSFSY